MIYKIIPDSKPHKEMMALNAQIESAKMVLNSFIQKVNAKSQYVKPPSVFVGLEGLGFDHEPDNKLWKKNLFPK